MPKRHCPNCYYPLPEHGKYCSNCGQKYTNGRVTFWTLIGDFLESVLNIDSKIFKTLRALLSPGKLSVVYFRGQQKSYVPPMRLFFVSAVIHFAVLSFVSFGQIEDQMDGNANGIRHDAFYSAFRSDLDSVRQGVEEEFNHIYGLSTAFDTLEAKLEDPRKDSFEMVYFKKTTDWGELEAVALALTKRDLIEMPLDSLPEVYGIKGFWNQLQVRQIVKLNREGSNFTRFALGKLIWMVVLMMPALALMLKLLYIRRNRYYVEHLVFSFHYHSFAFLFMTVLMLGVYTFPALLDAEEVAIPLAVMGVIAYLYLAMRRFYRQNHIKTFIKFWMINFGYLMLFTFFLLFTAILTTLTF
ncbi:MAG: DUF3667 domain-containing protein [Phaeodactylibacter sp.]|nr:DUF3667 domain-containing protein [Phaeodactylibacter sp.]